jgi:hypothetical protein
MQSLHAIISRPTLTNEQKAIIAQCYERGYRIRVNRTPISRQISILALVTGYWGDKRWRIQYPGTLRYAHHQTRQRLTKAYREEMVESWPIG